MGKNNAKMIDPKLFLMAGIDPKTGLPLKLVEGDPTHLKAGLKHFYELIDEQDAVNRYKWYNLPCNLTSQELERMLYYRGQLAFFYIPSLDSFYFMPYALDGTIDFYGRFNTIHPIPYAGTGDEKLDRVQREYLSKLHLDCKYGVVPDEEVDADTMINSAVLLHDYTKELGQTIIPRKNIQDPVLDVMSDCVPFMRTALIAGTGVRGVRVNDADQAQSIFEGSKSLEDAARTGKLYVPVVGNLEFQDLTDGTQGKSEEYMLALQSLDNLRLSSYGLENGGVFEKKAHTLESEQDMNTSNVGLVYQDGLSIRQNFCDIVNSIWGLGIWCEPSESVLGKDQDGDGKAYDSNDAGEHGGVENESNNDSNV